MASNNSLDAQRPALEHILAGLAAERHDTPPAEQPITPAFAVDGARIEQEFSAIAAKLRLRLEECADQAATRIEDLQVLLTGETYLATHEQIASCSTQFSSLTADILQALAADLQRLESYLALQDNVRASIDGKLKTFLNWPLSEPPVLLATRRGEDLVAVALPHDSPALEHAKGLARTDIDRLIQEHAIKNIVYYSYPSSEGCDGPIIREVPSRNPGAIIAGLRRWLISAAPRTPETKLLTRDEYFEIAGLIRRHPGLIDFLAPSLSARFKSILGASPALSQAVPFDAPEELPPAIPATPRRRSALFLHNSYYHFKYLSAALRDRGWDAVAVSMEPPDSSAQQFFHGEDLSLYHPDANTMRENIRRFFRSVPERFGAVHFYGKGQPSFFPDNWEESLTPQTIPWDFFELRRHNVLIGYMPSGCVDGASQSSIRRLTNGVCGRCVWENRPDVCSDARNLTWAGKLASFCDFVTLEGDLAVDDRVGPMYVRRPIVTALDPEYWHPDLAIPEEHRLKRDRDELIVYHGVGLSKVRRSGGRDIKGTGAIMAAMERLQAEGLPVRLFFTSDLKSTDVRYYQLQSDIVVDQLNYGRLGANARETLMLGRPLITCLRPQQEPPLPPLQPIEDVPALHATEETIYEVLKTLILDPERRKMMGKAGRDFALQWHAAPVCALRYERLVDRLRAGLPPEDDEVFA